MEPPIPADPIRRTIVLGPAAHELRRHVGPTAWVVLEELLQRAPDYEVDEAGVETESTAFFQGYARMPLRFCVMFALAGQSRLARHELALIRHPGSPSGAARI